MFKLIVYGILAWIAYEIVKAAYFFVTSLITAIFTFVANNAVWIFFIFLGLAWLLFYLSKQGRLAIAAEVKEHEEQISARITRQEIWVDQTKDELIKSRGQPTDIVEENLKTKQREILKYKNPGRQMLYIYLEDGVVTGWKGSIN